MVDGNEIITGPIQGYYVAAYACPSHSDREEFVPYFKLFCDAPESYFEQGGCLFKGRPPIITNDVTRALALALAHAREAIEMLPSPQELAGWRRESLAQGLRVVNSVQSED